MKRFFICSILVLLASLSGMAQKPLPFVEEGKMWTISRMVTYGAIGADHSIYEPYRNEYHRYVIRGDTLINGKTYKKIYDHSIYVYYEDNSVETNDQLADFAIREDDGVVYHYHYDRNPDCKETIWFDFNLKAGDSFSSETWAYLYRTWPISFYIKEVKTWDGIGIYGGKKYWDGERKCWVVSLGESSIDSDGNKEYVVEGIGGLLGLLEFKDTYVAMDGSVDWPTGGGGSESLTSVHDGSGKLIFGTDIKEEINNLVTGIAPITTEKPADNAIYDLSGRRLQQAPSQGFYIQGGKKRLAR